MNIIAALAKKMCRFGINDRTGLGSALRKIAFALASMDALMAMAADLEKQVSSLTAVHFGFALPIEDNEDGKAGSSGDQTAVDLLIDFRQLGNRPIGEVLRAIFTNPDFRNATAINMKVTEAHGTEKIFYWKWVPFENPSPARLAEGGKIRSENGQIMHSTQMGISIPFILPYLGPLFAAKETAINATMPLNEALTKSFNRDAFREPGDLSTILMAPCAGSSFLFGAPFASNVLEVISDQIRVTFNPEDETAESMNRNENNAGKTDMNICHFIRPSAGILTVSAMRSKGVQQGLIEIPAFIPNLETQSIKKGDVICNSSDFSTVPALQHEASPLLFGMSLISNALDMASNQVKVTFDLEQAMAESTGQGEYKTGKTEITDFPFKQLLAGNASIGNLRILDNISAGGWKDVVISDLATDIDILDVSAALQREGYLAIKDLAVAEQPHIDGFYAINVTAAPGIMPFMQQGPSMFGDAAARTEARGNVAHFHNTFNIVINIKGRTETEIKDLGKKIGLILSDEMRQYGGIS